MSVLLLLVTSAAFGATPSGCSLNDARRALSAESLQAQPEPSNADHILCDDFATDGVMIVLEGTPPYVNWTVYQKGRGWTGVETSRPRGRSELGAPLQDEGALVADVKTGSPAAKAGIRVEDRITTFDGNKVYAFTSLNDLAAQSPAGKKVEIDILRGGKIHTLELIVGRQDGWRRVQTFQPYYGKSISILANGDVLQEGVGDHQITWHWSNDRFSTLRIDPPFVASGCSLADAKELAFRNGAAEGTPYPDVSSRLLMCDDFARNGVMLFPDSPFAKGQILHSIRWLVYRKLGSSWNNIQTFSIPDSSSLRVGDDGALVENNIGNYQKTWRWNGSNFAVQSAVASNIVNGCSLAVARYLNAQEYEAHGDAIPVSPSSADDVLCQDYVRYGVMIFREGGGSDVSGFAVYRKQTDGKWKKLKNITLDNSQNLTISTDGNLLAENEWSRDIYYWNGRNFSSPEKTQLVTYWNGTGWERAAVAEVTPASTPNCSFALAQGIFEASAKSLFPSLGNTSYPGQRPTRFVCADFTGSGEPQIAFSVPEWPCHACNSWLIFERRAAAWTLVFQNESGLCIEPKESSTFGLISQEYASDTRLQETREVYRWNGQKFALLNKSIVPSGSCKPTENTTIIRHDAYKGTAEASADAMVFPPPVGEESHRLNDEEQHRCIALGNLANIWAVYRDHGVSSLTAKKEIQKVANLVSADSMRIYFETIDAVYEQPTVTPFQMGSVMRNACFADPDHYLSE